MVVRDIVVAGADPVRDAGPDTDPGTPAAAPEAAVTVSR
jgi:hypothetical protein